MSILKKPKKKNAGATAVQASHDNHHVVGFGNLRVLICEEDGAFFAQGLELDYAAQGNSLADAQKQFESGLAATVQEHLRIFGSIEKMLKQAPEQVWKEILSVKTASSHSLSQVSMHDVGRELPKNFHENLPFDGIAYFHGAAA